MVIAIKKTIQYKKSETIAESYNVNFFVGELFKFSRFILQMLWAFPVAIVIRWKLRKNKKLNEILKFEALLPVRNTLEKGSFAYDALLFKVSLFDLFKNKTHLANLVCLAIIIGDEYIDGLAQTVGKGKIVTLLKEDTNRFYLKIVETNNCIKLHYSINPEVLFDKKVLDTVNIKYGISYSALYKHLLFLLEEINSQIAKQPSVKQPYIAQMISQACNNCFDTYIEDIVQPIDNYSYEALEKYQKRKDDAVVNKLLQLRAVLLDKTNSSYQAKFASWSSMLRSMQLYDDMQDVAFDFKFQKNVLAFYAKKYYQEEWLWLEKNETTLQLLSGAALHVTICTYMPGASICVMQQARKIALHNFDWVQLKIQNYLWRKNWLCLDDGSETAQSVQLFLKEINNRLSKESYNDVCDEEKAAHVLQLLLLHKPYNKIVCSVLNYKERYLLKSYFVELAVAKKSFFYYKVLTAISK